VGQIGLLDRQRQKKPVFPHFSVEIFQTTKTFRLKEKKDLFKKELPEKDEAPRKNASKKRNASKSCILAFCWPVCNFCKQKKRN
jgi:hypothetical protein